MAKPKQRHANKNNNPRDNEEDESWVIVKKQKVNILIPPLPVTEISVIPTLGPTEIPAICVQNPDKEQRRVPLEMQSLDHVTRSEIPNKFRICNNNTLGLSSALKVSKNQSNSYVDRALLLKQRMRASNLERKIRRAGGLSSWLTSIGLYQFVKIFQGQSVNKFQLVNMTMKKLKDMGADAVGPRRKLMHAIDCLCQPYCFETLHKP